jgi:hypothetical protein
LKVGFFAAGFGAGLGFGIDLLLTGFGAGSGLSLLAAFDAVLDAGLGLGLLRGRDTGFLIAGFDAALGLADGFEPAFNCSLEADLCLAAGVDA